MMLSIVIVSYNARADLENCLLTLTSDRPAVPHDITVVDNASSDGSAAAVRSRWPLIQVIEREANEGFARANNVGIRARRRSQSARASGVSVCTCTRPGCTGGVGAVAGA